MRFIDRIVDNLDALLAYGHSAIWRTNPREFLDIATTDDDQTFVLKDGTLMTVIRLKGLTSTMFDREMVSVIEEISEIMGRDLIKSAGHHFTISYEFDPDSAKSYAQKALAPTKRTGQRLGMGDFIDAIVEEKAEKMAGFCQVENTYIALYTTVASIHKAELKGQIQERTSAMKTWPDTAESLLNDFAFPQLRVRHKTMVESFISSVAHLKSLKDVTLMTERVSVRAYLREMKRVTEPGSSPRWQPRIDSDFLKDIRVPTNPRRRDFKNADHLMPPPFGEQLMGSTPASVGLKYAVMGDRIHYPLAISMGPSEPETFEKLIQQASTMRLPFRVCFAFKGTGTGVDYMNTMLAKTFPWASSANGQIKKAHEDLVNYETNQNGVVPAMYVTACTWAPVKASYNAKTGTTYDLSEITDRATKLNRAFQSWGGCQTTDAFAAPIEGTLGSQAGLYDHPLGTVMAPTMPDAIGLSPLFRPTTSWGAADGNVLLRTKDGRFLHYQQTSPRQSAWVTLLVGPMGYAKSTTLNTLNLYYLLTPSPEPELPFLRSLDIGASSRSIIDLVQASVTQEEKNIAQYIRIQNTSAYQVNPFDTPLGLEFPLANHLDFLGNLIGTICYSMQGDPTLEKQLPGIISTATTLLYERYASPANGGDRARIYSALSNKFVAEKVNKYGIETDERTTWHEVRDALFDAGEVRAAMLAHRKATPQLSDLISVVSSEAMRSEYPDTVGGVEVLSLFARSIREAVEMFPMLNGETKFELGQAKVISLDMEELVPREQTERARWKASIAFFIGYDILTRDFFMHSDYLAQMPRRYAPYHARKIRQLETSRKRFSMDERQRFAKIPSAQSQVDGLIAEGRKNLVDIQVASQLFEHHTEASITLSSTVIILGAGNMSGEEAANVKTRFDLSDAQMTAIRRMRPPTSKGAEAFIIFRTRDGNQSHHVMLSDGSMYLWLIATEAVDRSMRALAYDRYPAQEALQRLAKKYPGGSIKNAIDNALADMDETDASPEQAGDLIRKMANDL